MCAIAELLVDFKLHCRDNSRTDSNQVESTPTEEPPTPASAASNSQRAALSTESQTTRPSSPHSAEKPIDCNNDSHVLKAEWFVVPNHLLSTMVLPRWFPAAEKPMTEAFKSGFLIVDIDKYQHLTDKQALFVYRAFIRSAHKRSVKLHRAGSYSNYPNFKNRF